MKSRCLAAPLAVAVLVSAPCTFAQAKASPAPAKASAAPAAASMPKPAPEMSQLKFFDGSWTCSGTMMPSPFGPGGKMTSTVKSHADLGGFWQSGIVKGNSPGMPPFEGMFHMTYDPAGKRHLMLWVDNMGGWAQSTAPGWEGDKIVFTGDSYMGGQKYPTRDTFAKNADGTMKHSWEMQNSGNWSALGDETCKKAAAGAAKK